MLIPGYLQKITRKKYLLNCLRSFKREVIEILFDAANVDYRDYQKIDGLLSEKQFDQFFHKDPGKMSSNPWYDMLNGLEERHYSKLVNCCEFLAREIEFTLITFGESNDEAFQGLKGWQLFLQSLDSLIDPETGKLDYDTEKYFFRELNDIFTGWDFIEGQKKHPHLVRCIKRL